MNQAILAHNYKYEYYAIIVALLSISAVKHFAGGVSNLVYVVDICFLVFSFSTIRKSIDKITLIYCISLFIGYFFHKANNVKDAHLSEVLLRIIPVLIIIYYKSKRNFNNKTIRFVFILFFLLECMIAIYERITLTHLIAYSSEDQAMNVEMNSIDSFRSFSLIYHPLENANIVCFFLSFILCSNNINIVFKSLLITLGTVALWSFNSRAALLMWIIIIVYRFFLYNKPIYYILGLFLLLPIIELFPILLSHIESTGFIGRLAEYNDNSSLTRLIAWNIFISHDWSLHEVIMGGTVLLQPVYNLRLPDVVIENGALADLGYWGFIIGPIKIVGEIFISYIVLHRYSLQDRIIIMLSLWGVAFMNNNTYWTFLLPFYMFAFLSFGTNQKQLRSPRLDNKESLLSISKFLSRK